MSSYKETYNISSEDYILILQDGCVKIIKYEEFIKEISLGGFSVCEAWLNCIYGIGAFTTDEIPSDTPPTMQDLYISLLNRQQDHMFTSDDFLSKYYDAEKHAFGKIIITGGDVTGYSLNGTPVHIGMVINSNQLASLQYDSKNQDASYIQDLFFEAYDVNNVKAESI